MKKVKKRIVSTSFAMVVALSLASCGNAIPAMNEKDSEMISEEVIEMVEDDTSLGEIMADAGEPVEQSVEADKAAEQTAEPVETSAPVEAEKPAEIAKPAETAEPKTETAKTETTAPAQTSAPAQQTTAPAQTKEPSAPAQTEQPVTQPTAPTAAPAPVATPIPEPVHEHSWKEHVATTQTWIPNIVVVDDYETRYVEVGSHYICACGQCETDDPDIISDHVKESVRANDGLPHNFTIWSRYGEETVKVGSHEEDQGHYDTSSYVDYYYCDCGATK